MFLTIHQTDRITRPALDAIANGKEDRQHDQRHGPERQTAFFPFLRVRRAPATDADPGTGVIRLQETFDIRADDARGHRLLAGHRPAVVDGDPEHIRLAENSKG